MNRGPHGRRLASPVRLTLSAELGAPVDGAWWPHSASIAGELPELIEVLSPRLGQVVAINVNWTSLEASPDLDAAFGTMPALPGGLPARQRLMAISGSHACANILVVPCRTSGTLALMLLRQAANLPITPSEATTQTYRSGDHIVRAARAESESFEGRLRTGP
ncbi:MULTISPECIES: DUF5994 family protein [Mycobacterium]|uniref:Uncharacterized protein n=1 Tax=Mycobacterium gordonae TaxID=1778 RepID=A0A0Q2LRM2_MYCGO|nr:MULTISPECIES: DUF5994 family protein [Mycobacterium]KQH78346.1 hypothetical protein AO501_03070 [Mycobacterium gordonae]MDP7730306.1 DUF5994 family protein [Mycobacterium sp. TY813]